MKRVLNIYLVGNTYHFKKRIPKRHVGHPFFNGQKGFVTQSLHTSDRTIASKRASKILTDWDALDGPLESQFNMWRSMYREDVNDIYRQSDPEDAAQIVLELHDIIEEQAGSAELKALQHSALQDAESPSYTRISSLKELALADQRKAGSTSPKGSLEKIKRSCSWIAEAGWIDLKELTWADVDKKLSEDRDDKAASTLQGYLYGASRLWASGAKRGWLSSTNPFKGHSFPADRQSYDAFSWDEVSKLHAAAESNTKLQQAIEIAATTGARATEVCSIKCVADPATGELMWAVMYESRGKTDSSTRLLPVHQSLRDLYHDGFRMELPYKTLQRWFKKLREDSLGECLDPLTNKPRKLSMHSFRATVATHLIHVAGFSESTAAEYTGHSASKESRRLGISQYVRSASFQTKIDMADSIPWPPGSLTLAIS